LHVIFDIYFKLSLKRIYRQKVDDMDKIQQVHESMLEAIGTIQGFVKEVTGQDTTQEEIAQALTRYFVLNEIKDFIELQRSQGDKL